ncbi:hypothetical protein CCACVL1_11024 [Corchorus capsularis]|uniref:Uncharacterized protein n=1 Tax=Corchorus capsularis TaxID=210143 RepID=A0A1R3INA3_COCAP|nr:hypothetical protein CCACVL1_11024 [Corchorus capsularis]
MGWNKEALVVCSDRSTGVGITVRDLETGEQLLHIPTCAAAPNGLLCLRNHFLAASQSNRHGSFGGGAIFIWPLNKPQSPLRSYTMEAIGPLSCTNDGIYIAGGAPSGNLYLWEVANGRLLRTWRPHHKSFKCMVFSHDGSFLICGSSDGIICAWSMISLLDLEDSERSPPLLHFSSEHRSSITGLVTLSGSQSIIVSSSLDGTCKIWDLVSGRLLQTQVHPTSITAITLDPVEQLLFSGSMDGNIYVNVLHLGQVEDPLVTTKDQAFVLKGHNGSITALTFSGSGLISASEDCTFCLWDTVNWVVAKRFDHKKGAVTNMVVIKQSTLSNHEKVPNPNQFRVSLLQKYPQPTNSSKGMGMPTFLSLSANFNRQPSADFQGNNLLDHLILNNNSEREKSAALTMQLKVEKSIDERKWVTSMTKHVMEMNKHLQSRLLDMVQWRLLCRPTPIETDSSSSPKKKRQKPNVH